jgi:LysR family nitrogen assimilation transcriptional regulator
MTAAVDLRQLRYFVAIVDHGSLSAAAKALHVAQPALSHHLKNLESSLGHRLLRRDARGVQTTREGELLFRHAVGLLRQADGLRVALDRGQATLSGAVAVGLPKTVARLLALPFFEAVRERHPQVTLEIVDGHSQDLGRAVVEGRMDLALIMPPGPLQGSIDLPLLQEELVVVMAPDAPWRPPSRSLTPAQLAALPMLLSNRRERLHALLAAMSSETHITLAVRGHLDELGSLLGAVKAAHGATLLPWCAVGPEVARGELIALRIRGQRLTRQLLLSRSQTLPLTAAATAAGELLAATCGRLIEAGLWRGARLLRHGVAAAEG